MAMPVWFASVTAPELPRRATLAQTVMLCVAFGVFAILLNSVGAVILQSMRYFRVTAVAAGSLEAFKDLTIAVASLLLAAQLPRFGLRLSMLVALLVAAAGCLLVPVTGRFWAVQAMFFATGFGFALMKVSVYALIGQLSDGPSAHARLLGIIEAAFMASIVASAWVFAAFIDPDNAGSQAWLQLYWMMALLCAGAALLVLVIPVAESPIESGAAPIADAFAAMRSLAARRMTQIFIVSIFCYVLVEQGLGSWLPAINNRILGLDGQVAVRAASAFAMMIALGRLIAGLLVVRIGWFRLLMGCIGMIAVILALVPYLATTSGTDDALAWRGLPVAAMLLPMIGFFMAPIYPTLSSVVLSAVPRQRQAALTGLIVVFSALGGVSGSQLIAIMFDHVNGASAILALLAPLAVLTALIVWLRRSVRD